MKQIFYSILALGVALSIVSCQGNDPNDLLWDDANRFITFDTKSGAIPNPSVNENEDLVMAITIAALKGSSVTVDFTITPPSTSNSESAQYQLLNMDGTVKNDRSVTFPEGTGTQQFIFRPVDNEILDNNRAFAFALTGNSAGYRIGVNKTGEGSKMNVTVVDNEHRLMGYFGKWTVEEFYEDEWHPVGRGDVTIGKADPLDQVMLTDFPMHPQMNIPIPLILDTEAGTVKINAMTGVDVGYGPLTIGILDWDTMEVATKPYNGTIVDNDTIEFQGTFGAKFEEGGRNYRPDSNNVIAGWDNVRLTRATE